MSEAILAPRTALYLPASNPRAIAKARTLTVDLLILDLEDAVKPADKAAARHAAVAAAGEGMGCPVAIRVNGVGTREHDLDIAAVATSAAAFVVLPKVEAASAAADVAMRAGKPLLAMIETPRGVLAAAAIADADGVAGLIAGTNDLAHELGIPPGAGRGGLGLALQMIVLAARAGGGWALDGVFNTLDDAQGLAEECRAGRAMGFDGKTLIHPNQVGIAAEAFGPTAAELDDARALIAAASGGAERFRERMIETMHVEAAKALVERSPT
jgi:citrate lyase subunit beta/citryl-CoA lyase